MTTTISINLWLMIGIIAYAMLSGAAVYMVFFKDDEFEKYLNWKLPLALLLLIAGGGAICIVYALYAAAIRLWHMIRFTELPTLFQFFVLRQFRNLTVKHLYIAAHDLYKKWDKESLLHRYKRWVINLILRANEYEYRDNGESKHEYNMWRRIDMGDQPYREYKDRVSSRLVYLGLVQPNIDEK